LYGWQEHTECGAKTGLTVDGDLAVQLTNYLGTGSEAQSGAAATSLGRVKSHPDLV
jgi:hypothetical protein